MLNLQTPRDRSAAAGEYVLGTLAPDEREAFERALGGDAALRAEVAHWQDRFLALSARWRQPSPPAGLWRRIEHACRRGRRRVPRPRRRPGGSAWACGSRSAGWRWPAACCWAQAWCRD